PRSARGSDTQDPTKVGTLNTVTTLDVEGELAAVVPMRLNMDAFSDLLILKNGGEAPITAAMTVAAHTFTVNSTSTSGDFQPGDGVCSTGFNVCSLRAAIDEVNAGPGGDLINFSISSIPVASGFSIGKAVTIDGGASRVELKGTGNGMFMIQAANCVVRGLVINRTGSDDAISLNGDPTNPFTSNSFIEGNYIGTDVTGTSVPTGYPFAQSTASAVSTHTNDNTIGGTVSAARNVIAGFVTGVNLSNGLRNKVQGNYIGTDVTGTKILNNRRQGVRIGSPNNTIGGTQSGAGNIIAFGNADTFDLGTGVLFEGGDGNAVRRNSIFGYGEGISFTNFSTPIPRAPTPVLTTTGGTLSGAKPNISYTIEFFSNPDCFFRQGKTFIGDTTVLT